MDDQSKNLLLATALSFVVILVWFVLFPPPEPPLQDETPITATSPDDAETLLPPTGDTGTAAPEAEVAPALDIPRVAIETPRLTGSVSLRGGRIDDLLLKDYGETLDDDADLVRILSPIGTDRPYYAIHGWIPTVGASAEQVPGPNTDWTVEGSTTLTPETPLTLVWDNDAGLIFRKTIEVDGDFMFTVTQSVENGTGAEVALRPYGIVAQHGMPDLIGFFILHEGIVRMSDGTYDEFNYDKIPAPGAEDGRIEVAENGWIGFTDQYWMTALIPEPGTGFRSVAKAANDILQTETVFEQQVVPAGSSASSSSRVFAGAQEWETIRGYQSELGIDRFIDVIDWGWFFFLTKPIFAMLYWINAFIGNMGWSIIGLTLIIKAALFPLAYKSYSSMAKMRELQPEMEKLKERAGDDREALQKGMMELYKTNKVNPAAGCLPILLQIPIFFSLYKVIFVTIELRHAPWFGWIRDLSAPDPSSIFNLFGLLPYTVPSLGLFEFLSLGILPILLGVSMWLQMKLNPAPTDATQKMIFGWMPWVFMFLLGPFASGLVVYWIANNVITFSQQYIIMRSQGYKPDLVGNMFSGLKRGDASEKK